MKNWAKEDSYALSSSILTSIDALMIHTVSFHLPVNNFVWFDLRPLSTIQRDFNQSENLHSKTVVFETFCIHYWGKNN